MRFLSLEKVHGRVFLKRTEGGQHGQTHGPCLPGAQSCVFDRFRKSQNLFNFDL